MKSTAHSYYMSKPPYFLTRLFKYNKEAHDNLSNNVCNSCSRSEWRIDRISGSYYFSVEGRKYQDCLLDLTPLDCIICYIMEDAVGDKYFKELSHKR